MWVNEQELESAYVRSVLECARIRATARRQLKRSIPIMAVVACIAIIATFSFGRAAPPVTDDRGGPPHAPVSSHSTMLCSTNAGAADVLHEVRAARKLAA
jgi:hypothetical protein